MSPTLPPKVREVLRQCLAPVKFGSQCAMLLDSRNNPIEYDRAYGMFLLDRNAEFKIVIGNYCKEHDIDITVKIDGVEVGTFPTSSNSVWILERPQYRDQKFRFDGNNSQCEIIVRRKIEVRVPDDSPHEHEVELFEKRVIDVCTCAFQMGLRPKTNPLAGNNVEYCINVENQSRYLHLPVPDEHTA